MKSMTLVSLFAFLLSGALSYGAIGTGGVSPDAITTNSPGVITIDLTAGSETVDVPEGDTVTVAAVVANVAAHITKTGGGTLVLPNTNLSASYSNLVVEGGLVSVSAENNFGAGTVTLSGGGGLYIAKTFSLARAKIIFASGSSGTIITPSGVTLTVTETYFVSANATFVKQGAGTVKADSTFRGTNSANAYWLIDSGTLHVAKFQQFASGPTVIPTLALEVHETATVLLECQVSECTLGALVLRGGTVSQTDCTRLSTSGKNIINPLADRKFYLNGTVTVNPSTNGQPSVIQTSACYFSGATGNGKTTVFDVKQGATLHLDCKFPASSGNLRKTGQGTLRLLKPLWTTGFFDHQEGTVTFADGAVHYEPAMTNILSASAVIRLEDRAVLDAATQSNALVTVEVPENASAVFAGVCGSTNPSYPYTMIAKTGAGNLLFSGTNVSACGLNVKSGTLTLASGHAASQAPIWLDASDTETVTTNGAGHVSAVLNKGFAGGSFTPYDSGDTDKHPTCETINGCGALRFDGNDTLQFKGFTNGTPRELFVYIVKQRVSYKLDSTSFSFGSSSATANDDSAPGALLMRETAANKYNCDGGTQSADLTVADASLAALEILHVHYNAAYFGSVVSDSVPSALASMGGIASSFVTTDWNTRVNLWQLGGRLGVNGVPRSTLLWDGRIGELIVFSQPLNYAQATALIDYLRKKWFGVGDGSATPPPFLAGYTGAAPDGKLDLALADGTALAHAAATLPLNSLSVTGAVAVTRTGPTSSALFTIADDLAFNDAAITLSLDPFPEESTVLMTYGGSFTGADPAWTLPGKGEDFAKVRHNAGKQSVYLSIIKSTVILLR